MTGLTWKHCRWKAVCASSPLTSGFATKLAGWTWLWPAPACTAACRFISLVVRQRRTPARPGSSIPLLQQTCLQSGLTRTKWTFSNCIAWRWTGHRTTPTPPSAGWICWMLSRHGLLGDWALAENSVRNLATAGLCLRFKYKGENRDFISAVPHAWKISDKVQSKINAWRAERNITKYLAFHWRRGDVVIDHGPTFIKHTPENVIQRIKIALAGLEGSVSAIVLLSDNFMKPELRRIAQLSKSELNMPMYRYGAGEELWYDFDDIEARAQGVIVDICLGVQADLFTGSYPGSYYASFIQQLRTAAGHPSESALFLPSLPTEDADHTLQEQEGEEEEDEDAAEEEEDDHAPEEEWEAGAEQHGEL
eukprot:m.139152 g.139152  ORF g.139152 m.139152 type:complete len:364 (-) comp20298_c0_seq5:58-1149(-)